VNLQNHFLFPESMGQSLIRTILSEPNLVRLDRLMILMIGLYVFLNPFPRVTSIREICFYSSLGILLLLVCTGRRKFSWSSPFSLPLLLLVIWSIAGIPLAVDPGNSIHDVFAHLLKHVALYYMLVHTFPSQAGLHRLIQILVASVGLFSLAGLVLFYGVLGYPLADRFNMNIDTIRFAGMSANYMGFAIVPGILLCIHSLVHIAKSTAARVVLTLFLCAAVTAIFFTQTRGAMIAMVVGIILLFIKDRAQLLAMLAGIVVLAAIIFNTPEYAARFSPKDVFGNERVSMIHMYMQMVHERPIMGTGFGMDILQRREYMKPYYDRVPESYRDHGFHVSPHNFYLDVTVRLGIVGLLLYLAIAAGAFHRALQAIRQARDKSRGDKGLCMLAAWIAFLIQALFADASFGVPAVMFYLLLAMITILWKQSFQTPPGDGVEAVGARG